MSTTLRTATVGAYAKAIEFTIAAALSALVAANTDGVVTAPELVNIAIFTLGIVGVYWAPNLPEGWRAYFKGIVAFGTGALIALQSAITAGVTPGEWAQIAVAALGAIGVVIVPNTPLAAAAPAAVSTDPFVEEN